MYNAQFRMTVLFEGEHVFCPADSQSGSKLETNWLKLPSSLDAPPTVAQPPKRIGAEMDLLEVHSNEPHIVDVQEGSQMEKKQLE